MSAPPRCYTEKKVAMLAALVFFQLSSLSPAQNFTSRYANSDPFGVNGPMPFGDLLPAGVGEGLKGGIDFALAIQSIYDSNFFQTEHEKSEFATNISPRVSYSTDPEGGASVTISAGYLPVVRSYLHNTNLDGVDQSGNVSIIVSGSRTQISAYAGYIQESGTDRLAGEFVTGSALSLGLRGTYQIAPRTSGFASVSSSISDYGNSTVVGFDNISANFGGSWAATERFSFGPSISYAKVSSDNTGTRDSWGFSMNTSYAANERIQLAVSLGLQYSENSRESQAGDFNLTGSLSSTYKIDERWAWNNSIQSGIVPSPSQANYVINDWSVSSSLIRSLPVGSAGLGLDLYISSFERVGAAGASQTTEENLGVLLSYERPLFRDRIGFSTSVRYTINSGQDEWSQILISTGLNMEF
ncbi:MAG: hypothetical protein H7Y36_09780 [Armatimonadetes bacterium]|nr:hypothetical protein [Akkermansiaceae bacterium]